jgi:Tol biopolymer transport system component
MKRMLVLAMVALTAIASAQVNPEVAFRAAMETETVKGDLRAAIEQYKVVVDSGNRALAAQALVRMAGCYVKLNSDEARRLLERVVREFPDQSSAAAEARLQLQALPRVPERQAGTALRRVLTLPPNNGIWGNLGGGRFLGYVRDGNLIVKDLVTEQERSVTTKREAADYAEGHAFSRDGRRLVYSWYRSDRDRYELYMTTFGSDLSHQSRLLFESGDIVWMNAGDWSPDGSLVAISLQRADKTEQLGILSVADRSLRTLKSTGWRSSGGTIAFSPDGRYLAFDLEGEDSAAGDVITLAVDGSSENTVVSHASDDDFVGWSPDGGHLLFESDRGGQRGLWSLAVRNGAADGQPHLVRSSIEPSFFSLGFNSQGDLLYSVRSSLSEPARVQTARVNFAADALDSQPENVNNDPYEGSDYPHWSRDGRILAHVTYPVGRPGAPVLTVRSISTGAVTVVKPRLRYLAGFSFSPDAQSVIAAGGDFRGRFGLFRIYVPNGETQLVMPGQEFRSLAGPRWSRDGRTLFYIRNLPGSRSFVARDLASGNEREIARGKVSATALPSGNEIEIGGLGLSPDEQYIVTAKRKPFAITLIAVEDGATRTMLQASEELFVLAWAPDSRAFYARRRSLDGKGTETVRISLDGDIRPAPGFSTLEPIGQFFAQPGGSLIAFPKRGGQISRGNVEVWALENILPAIKGGR